MRSAWLLARGTVVHAAVLLATDMAVCLAGDRAICQAVVQAVCQAVDQVRHQVVRTAVTTAYSGIVSCIGYAATHPIGSQIEATVEVGAALHRGELMCSLTPR